MSRETLEALDRAVAAHYADVLANIPETHPLVSGWVLAAEIETIEDGETCWDNDYTTGDRTRPNTATGLATWLCDELRDIRAIPDDDPEGEDEL